jgi:hypothetical protein
MYELHLEFRFVQQVWVVQENFHSHQGASDGRFNSRFEHGELSNTELLHRRMEKTAGTLGLRLVRLAYQPPASSTFLSEQNSHQQPASSTFLSEQTSTSHQPPAKRT